MIDNRDIRDILADVRAQRVMRQISSALTAILLAGVLVALFLGVR